MCSSPSGSNKQSDIGSFGSSFQGTKGDTSEHVALMPSVCEAPENGRVGSDTGDEVDSPVKNVPTEISESVGPPIEEGLVVHPAETVVTAVTSSATEGLTLNEGSYTFPFSEIFVDQLCCSHLYWSWSCRICN